MMQRDQKEKEIAHPDYDKLPACIKHTVTEREYAWMDETMRAQLIETETTPDWSEV